jgi:hypothetical protein
MSKLKELCEANKPISCIKGKDADGGTVDFIDVPDNKVRLDAVKEVISLYNDYPVKQVAGTFKVEGSVSAETREAARAAIREMIRKGKVI